MQVIFNDVWEVEVVTPALSGSMIHTVKLTHTETGECFERTRFDVGKLIFIDAAPTDTRPKERLLLSKWLVKGAPR